MYPENSAANMYGAISAPVSITYAVNAPPMSSTNSVSRTIVTGRIFVRLHSALTPMNKNRAVSPSPRQNKKEYRSVI